MKIAIAHKQEMKGQRLRTALSKYMDNPFVWVANSIDGILEKCQKDKPDLILIDLNLAPSGLNTIAYIMKNAPCAIVLLAGQPAKDESLIFEAMGQGAMDVINAEFLELDKDFNEGLKSVLEKITMIGKLLGRVSDEYHPAQAINQKPHEKLKHRLPPLVLIGASTGGPAALAQLIKQFPKRPPFATIIIQHVDMQFSESLAQWLSTQTALPVQIAQERSYPEIGKIFLAGKEKHLIMTRNGELNYTSEPKDKLYQPSVDVFFKSVVDHWPRKSVAMVLTGMGDDGAQGLKALHEAGWFTIAEHPKSCVVFGMPKAAIELKGVSEILSLEQITPKILNLLDEEEKQ